MQTFDDAQRIIRIKTAGGFVQEEDTRARNKLARDAHAPFLTTGDATVTAGTVTDTRVADAQDTKLIERLERPETLCARAHLAW